MRKSELTGVTLVTALLCACLVAGALEAREPVDHDRPAPASSDIDTRTWIDANNILMFVSNRGTIACDHSGVLGKNDGFYYPFTSMDDISSGRNVLTMLFAGGLWIGGVDSASGDTLVTSAQYSPDWGVGPIVGDSAAPGSTTNPACRVYKLDGDELSGSYPTDYQEWPTTDGAPIDHLGRPLVHGYQTLWCIFNDLDVDFHQRPQGSVGRGLGVEVRQTVWALPGYTIPLKASPDVAGTGASSVEDENSCVYIKYQLTNRSSKTYNNFYISSWLDPDVGDASDDLVGCDTLSDMFFCYNHGSDANYGSNPPVVGLRLLEGPTEPSPGGVAFVNGRSIPDHRNLGIHSVIRFENNLDPGSYAESYAAMSEGRNGAGSVSPNGTRYWYPGDPAAGTGDLDPNAADVRMMGTYGPITFRPGETRQIILKLAAASSLSTLRMSLNQPWTIPSDVGENPDDLLPTSFSLAQNYPNPFNPTTTIEYSLPKRSDVTISILNILGQEVKTLINTSVPVGDHVTHWDGTDQAGKRVASGVYFYRIKADDYVSSKKMLLLK